jgi:hypothetical protein
MRRYLYLLSALGLLLVSATSASAAPAPAPSTATDTFYGVSTTPAGTSPVTINANDITVRASDGAYGIGYTYSANGTAFGQVPGTFGYAEHGYLYFKNLADPTTAVGSRFVSGVFTLQPRAGGKPIVIADTNPGAYTSGIQTVLLKHADDVSRVARGLVTSGGALSYGYFTFTNQFGTDTGYATPDFHQFIIEIAFAKP